MEHQILDHVKQALRVTLDWKAPSIRLPRKMSSVQFTTKSFTRHLLRMIDLEEMRRLHGGRPRGEAEPGRRIKRLRTATTSEFRARLEELEPEIEAMEALPEDQFEFVCSRDCRVARPRGRARRRGDRAAAGDAAVRRGRRGVEAARACSFRRALHPPSPR